MYIFLRSEIPTLCSVNLFVLGADKSLNRLIESKRTVGRWVFKTEADRQLVTSVCVQIKGDIYRGLGLWTLASTYIIKSIFGFKSLPKVDKKGWASSLSLLADAFQYMSLKDFNNTIKPKFQLTSDHPILEAIKCVNEASQLSIYSPLFFTKNKVSLFSKLGTLVKEQLRSHMQWPDERRLSGSGEGGL